MQKPKKTIRITTNYNLDLTGVQLQNEEVDNVVLEGRGLHVDHFQSGDQGKDVEVGELVEVVRNFVEVVVEAVVSHMGSEWTGRVLRDPIFHCKLVDQDQDDVRSCCAR